MVTKKWDRMKHFRVYYDFVPFYDTKTGISRKVKSGLDQEFSTRHFSGSFTRSEKIIRWGVPITKTIAKNIEKNMP